MRNRLDGRCAPALSPDDVRTMNRLWFVQIKLPTSHLSFSGLARIDGCTAFSLEKFQDLFTDLAVNPFTHGGASLLSTRSNRKFYIHLTGSSSQPFSTQGDDVPRPRSPEMKSSRMLDEALERVNRPTSPRFGSRCRDSRNPP